MNIKIIPRKCQSTCKLSSVLLNNVSSKKSQGKLKQYLELNGHGNRICQNLWDAAKSVFRQKGIVLND